MRPIVMILAMLCSCTTNPPPVIVGCPQIRDFSLEEEQAQSVAIGRLQMYPEIAEPLTAPLDEWSNLRAQLKPCKGTPTAIDRSDSPSVGSTPSSRWGKGI